MKHIKTSIPNSAVERTVRTYKQAGTRYEDQVKDCFLKDILIGQRVYNHEGVLIVETPMKDGLKHGREFTWNDEGELLLVEPYVKGKIHGTAKQYGKDGQVIGAYTLVHGTGFDIWRQETEDSTVYISEIHSLQDGVPHEYEWHFASSRQDLWQERHWDKGKLHGIERVWNSRGRLRRGYPKFYISDQAASKQEYLTRSSTDNSLPGYQEVDNTPQRVFPPEIQKLLAF